MRKTAICLLVSIILAIALSGKPCLRAQDTQAIAPGGKASLPLVGHPFSAVKFARRVRVHQGGKQQFLRNERYPSRIARDADGRLMMQVIDSDALPAECDRLDIRVPPPCPSWSVFVVDPVAHTMAHWPEGEFGAHVAVDFPLVPERLEEAVELTSTLPALGPDSTEEDGIRACAGLLDAEALFA